LLAFRAHPDCCKCLVIAAIPNSSEVESSSAAILMGASNKNVKMARIETMRCMLAVDKVHCDQVS